MKAGFEFDQRDENSLVQHGDGSMARLCSGKLRSSSRFLTRSPRLSVQGCCGGLALAGCTLPATITSSPKDRGENKKSRNWKAQAKVREVTDETD